MESMNLSEIARAVGGELSGRDALAKGVSIDSRTIKPEDLFVAIKGPRFDGHEFAMQAASQGASGVMISESIKLDADHGSIRVPDTLRALKELAYYYRKKFRPKLIGITGTNGKTTVKDMTAAILSARFKVLKNEGNLNNQYGIPLSLFNLNAEHQVAVMELGMSALGEIADLCRLVEPEIGIVTNVGEGHTQYLKDIETVGEAKGELLESLPGDGWAIVNGDDANVMVQIKRTGARVITYGLSQDCRYEAKGIQFGSDGATFSVNGQPFRIGHLGLHNVYNSLAAIAAGEVLGVGLEEAAARISDLKPTPMRLEIINSSRVTIINDAYNANPPSMRAALKTLDSFIRASRKVAILGDMLELGDRENQWHREIGALAADKADLVIAVGPLAKEIWHGASAEKRTNLYYQDNLSLISDLGSILQKGDVVLVKASRGRHFEEIINAIKGLS